MADNAPRQDGTHDEGMRPQDHPTTPTNSGEQRPTSEQPEGPAPTSEQPEGQAGEHPAGEQRADPYPADPHAAAGYSAGPHAADAYAAGQFQAGQYPAAETATAPPSAPAQRDHSRGTDAVMLVAGLLTVALAVYVVVGGSWNLQWVLALGAVAIGVVMLVASVRPRRQR